VIQVCCYFDMENPDENENVPELTVEFLLEAIGMPQLIDHFKGKRQCLLTSHKSSLNVLNPVPCVVSFPIELELSLSLFELSILSKE
jgi:hypothetical protein